MFPLQKTKVCDNVLITSFNMNNIAGLPCYTLKNDKKVYGPHGINKFLHAHKVLIDSKENLQNRYDMLHCIFGYIISLK